MSVVFDLDGTLIDTQKAVKMSYAYFGVRMPDEAWGKPWMEWLPEAAGSFHQACLVHAAKNEIYPNMIHKYAKRLPPSDLAVHLIKNGVRVRVLTGASPEGAKASLDFLGLMKIVKIIGTGANSDQKLKKLSSEGKSSWNEMAKKKEPVFYIDDDIRMIEKIEKIKKAKWRTRSVFPFHYTPETYSEIERKVLEQWMLSSLPPGETSDSRG